MYPVQNGRKTNEARKPSNICSTSIMRRLDFALKLVRRDRIHFGGRDTMGL